MTLLKDRFTPKQIEVLSSVGITSIYDLVTYIPFRLDYIDTMEASNEQSSITLFQAVLTRVEERRAGFYVLHLQNAQQSIQAYYFGKGGYVKGLLQEGVEFQFLITKRNGFWNVIKLSQLREPIDASRFILGRAAMQSYQLAVYHSNKQLTNTVLRQLHRKLEPNDYMLNLTGLVKKDGILPQILDLRPLHHPESEEDFARTKRLWITMQFYLHAALQRHLDRVATAQPAFLARQDVEILKELSATLPFELSRSQKEVIWNILQDISYVDAQ